MPKYFKLSGNPEPKVIGVRNGIIQGEIIWKNFKKAETVKFIRQYFSLDRYTENNKKIVPETFKIEFVKASASAKMTDFFMFTPTLWGIEFFVTDRVKELISSYNLPVHKFIEVDIFHKEKKFKYWALYIPQHYRQEALAFEKSLFSKQTGAGKELISFTNYEQYSQHGYAKREKLVFNHIVDQNLDLFVSSYVGGAYLISEELKDAIEKAGLTGILIEEPYDPEIAFE